MQKLKRKPDVVVSAEDHAAPGEAGRGDLSQWDAAAGAREAAAVPVSVQSEEQEPVRNLQSTSCTRLQPESACAADRRIRRSIKLQF